MTVAILYSVEDGNECAPRRWGRFESESGAATASVAVLLQWRSRGAQCARVPTLRRRRRKDAAAQIHASDRHSLITQLSYTLDTIHHAAAYHITAEKSCSCCVVCSRSTVLIWCVSEENFLLPPFALHSSPWRPWNRGKIWRRASRRWRPLRLDRRRFSRAVVAVMSRQSSSSSSSKRSLLLQQQQHPQQQQQPPLPQLLDARTWSTLLSSRRCRATPALWVSF